MIRENTPGKRRFFIPVYFFLLTSTFYSAIRSVERGAATEGREGGEVLGFIPVVNNIFIAASSEEKGAKVQFRGMFAILVRAVGSTRSSCSET